MILRNVDRQHEVVLLQDSCWGSAGGDGAKQALSHLGRQAYQSVRGAGVSRIIEAMPLALVPIARIALGVLVFLPIAGLASHDAGAVRPYDCRRELVESTRSAKVSDRYIKGVVSVGLNKGTTAIEAREMLQDMQANFFVPSPWQEYVVVCVPHGEEEAWVERFDQQDIVEWSHREGVRPLEAQGE
jgi:hypothetical protein